MALDVWYVDLAGDGGSHDSRERVLHTPDGSRPRKRKAAVLVHKSEQVCTETGERSLYGNHMKLMASAGRGLSGTCLESWS